MASIAIYNIFHTDRIVLSAKTTLGRDYLESLEKTKTREYNNMEALKRFVSLLLVACMAVSMVAGAEGRPKEEVEKG